MYQPLLPLNEFDLIKKYFTMQALSRDDVVLGIGDDAALLSVPPDDLLVMSMDTLVAGVHFPKNTSAYDIAYKALAVNLSDLAAMSATPAWMLLSLTMPDNDEIWLSEFSRGLFDLANQFNVALIGGDTTRGPLTVTIQINGLVPKNKALRRSHAKPSDKIYVTGTLGDAGLGLQIALGKIFTDKSTYFLDKLNRPAPQIECGILLRSYVTCAIDISDGLLADLKHILEASQVGAVVDADRLPLSSALQECVGLSDAKLLALTAGDDYELCFTVSAEQEQALLKQLTQHNVNATCIGEIQAEPGLRVTGYLGELPSEGYKHF